MSNIKITINGALAMAKLLEEEAPIACRAMKKILPYEGLLYSAKIIDNEISVQVPFFIDEPENLKPTRPGSVIWYNPTQAICIFYGQHKSVSLLHHWAELTGDWSGFTREAGRVWENQGIRIRFELVD